MAGTAIIAKGNHDHILFSVSQQRSLVLLIPMTLLVLSLWVALPLCGAAGEEGASHGDKYYNYEDVVVVSEPIRKACNGTVGECNPEEAEILMDSEINRRLLATVGVKKLSYGAVQDRAAACNGKSYSRCLPKPVNRQSRPCYKKLNCRSR